MSVPIHPLSSLAGTCVFAKQSQEPFHCDPDESGYLFLRTYEANLPSSLGRFLSSTLPFSGNLPVSVYGTVTQKETKRFFSALKFGEFTLAVAQAPPRQSRDTDTSNRPITYLHASSFSLTPLGGRRILTSLSIAWSRGNLRIRLRIRLTSD